MTKDSARAPKEASDADRTAAITRPALPYMRLPHAQRGKVHDETDEEMHQAHPVGAEIRITNLLFKSALQQKFGARNVTSAQWAFLRILWNEDGINQKDLAGRLNIHATTAVPALTILERNGYVRRERSGRDKRSVYIYLTDEGKQLAFELVPYAAELNERSLKGLSENEAAELMQLLWRVQQNLRDALDKDALAQVDEGGPLEQ